MVRGFLALESSSRLRSISQPVTVPIEQLNAGQAVNAPLVIFTAIKESLVEGGNVCCVQEGHALGLVT